MANRTSDNKLVFYICGRCGHKVYNKKGEKAKIPCTECGTKGTGDYDPSGAWKKGETSESSVPSSFKFNLKQFS